MTRPRIRSQNLLSEKVFLKVKARAQKLGVFFKEIVFEDNRVIFRCTSGTHKGLYWIVTVDVTTINYDYKLSSKSFQDITKALREAGLKVHCNDPSWLYWGHAYRAWKLGYGLKKETRRPTRYSAQHHGITVCKHVYAVMQVWPFWSTSLAKKFKPVLDARFPKESLNKTNKDENNDSDENVSDSFDIDSILG